MTPSVHESRASATPLARAILGVALFATLCLPPLVDRLESALTTHLLVQMPLLALSGLLAGPFLVACDLAPRHGGAAVAIAISGALFWMLPRQMDAALEHTFVEIAKFATLPLGVGAPLSVAWPRITSVSRAFLLANVVPMLVVLGWLYTSAPVRICNFYLIGDQARAGRWLLYLAGALALTLVARAFAPARTPARADRGARSPAAAQVPAAISASNTSALSSSAS